MNEKLFEELQETVSKHFPQNNENFSEAFLEYVHTLNSFAILSLAKNAAMLSVPIEGFIENLLKDIMRTYNEIRKDIVRAQLELYKN